MYLAMACRFTFSGGVDELRALIDEMSTHVAEMEKEWAGEKEENRLIVSRAHNLQVHVERLRKKMGIRLLSFINCMPCKYPLNYEISYVCLR